MMSVVLQKKAALFREQNGIGSGDAIRLKSLLLKMNVLTLFKPLTEGFSGMSLKVSEYARFMLINSNHSLGRQHFTIAHELYHLFVQNKSDIHPCKTGRFDTKNKNEYDADYFASCFLMPECGIYELIPDEELQKKKISLLTLIRLEQYFSVSRSSILVRLKMIGVLKTGEYELFKTLKASETARQFGFDTSLYRKGNDNLILGDYGSNAKLLFDREKISEGHYMELMQQIGIDITQPEYVDEC
jgi:Zn-dependent peptidase ImmA (M78 family)